MEDAARFAVFFSRRRQRFAARGMTFDKVRIRFRKNGDLRLVSHHDLMRAFERMLRRADLPFRSTEGFHPQPRVVFALSLPLGIAGTQEVVEIEWTEPVDPTAALERLRNQSPNGLSFASAQRITIKQAAKPRRAVYRLPMPPDGVAQCSPHAPREDYIAQLRSRCAELMASTAIWVERERPKPRQVNIRPYVKALTTGPDFLEMDLWVTQDGSARADELARALGLNHLLEAGAVIERTVLEIVDEIDPSELAAGPSLPTREDRAALERPSEKEAAKPPERPVAATAHRGASPSGPIVE